MALKEVLQKKTLEPYYKPPTIHIHIMCSKVQARVVAWDFTDVSASPRCSKLNKTVVISDGHSLAKLTLMEEFSCKVEDGKGYMMRGYCLKGVSPPRSIWVTRETQFFRSSPIAISAELQNKAQALINPESNMTSIGQIREAKGLITVVGQVIELSAIKKITIGREQVPMRNMQLQEGAAKVDVALWREVAISKVEVGESVRVTHLKMGISAYKDQLQSTTFSMLEMMSVLQKSALAIEVLGVLEGEEEGILELILGDDSQVKIKASLWEPMEDMLAKGRVFANLEMVGKNVVSIKVVEAPLV